MASPSVGLRVGGREYRGWKTARITRGIEAVSGSFDLSVSERWADQEVPWPIAEGDACTVLVNGEVMITGHIDTRTPSFGPAQHAVTVEGRDATGDLVDSSVVLDKWEFNGVPVLSIAQKICAPHGIKVSLQSGLVLPPASIPKKHSIDPGDTVANALETLCRVAGLLPVSDGVGGIVLTRSSTEHCVTDLVEGQNLLSGSAKYTIKDRFRTYKVLGQHKANDETGTSAAGVFGTAEDPAVPRASRVLVVRPEGNVTPAQAKKRAEWEATTRAARGDTVTGTVQGWTQTDGKVWPVNRLVRVRSRQLGVDGDLLITQATYSLSVDGGSTTQLELKRPDAFLPTPSVPGGFSGWPEIRDGALTVQKAKK